MRVGLCQHALAGSVTRRIDFVLLFAIGSLASTPAATAQAPGRFELQWNAPAACPDRDSARAAIDSALGARGAVEHAAVVVRVTVAEIAPERWTADIWMYGAAGSGERSVEATSCEQVAEAATLIVALAIAMTPDVEDSATPSEPTAIPPERTPYVQFTAGLRISGDVGSLPRADLGLAIVLGLQSRLWRVDAALTGWLPRDAYDGPAAASGGRFTLLSGGLRGCVDLLQADHPGAFSLGPCANVEAGATIGQGFGLSVHRTQSVFWGAGLLGLALRYRVASPLWLELLTEAGLPWHRAAWQVDDVGTVFRPSAVVGRASFALGWAFP